MTRASAPAPQKHALEFDDTIFEVDPAVGGRVTSFRLNGVDMLTGPEIDRNNYGSTLWTSPQTDWGWPPPAEFDQRPFSAVVEADALALVGPIHAALGIRLEKRFTIERALGAVRIEYVVRNLGATTKTYAAWEVSRVHPRGLTFFPTGDRGAGRLDVKQREGMTWYAHRPETLDDAGKKHSADGAGGYVAHAGRGLLYLKTFADLPPDRQAPGEGEVEVYGNNRYVEVEAQGPYAPIESGAASRWQVRWYLRKLDERVDVSIGSADLQAQVAAILRRERA